MKKTIMAAIAVCIVGCGDAEAKTPNTTEIKSTTNVIVVPNTETISYHLYRQEWRRVNNKPAKHWIPERPVTTRGDNEIKTVELYLDELSFRDAFRLEFLGKGEGHTFWWRGDEYTTNLLDVVHRPALVPVDHEDLREGGGDQGTIGE